MHSIETLRSKSNSCLQVLRVYRSFNVYKAASNEANDIKSTHIECLYNDPLIANCELNFKADSTPWFVLFFDRDSTAWIACCKHESIESENSRQANQQNENCIGIVLNSVPKNVFAENEILIGLLHYISIFIKACTKNGKYLGVSACFSLRISAMYISGGISIE